FRSTRSSMSSILCRYYTYSQHNGHICLYPFVDAGQPLLSGVISPKELAIGSATAGQPARACQTLAAFHSQLAQTSSTRREGVTPIVLSTVAKHRIENRPDRSEPHVRKQHPKS